MRLYFLIFIISTTKALPQGAPTKVCQSLRPYHSGIQPQDSVAPYSLTTRRIDGSVIITMSSPLNLPFQGFMIQGRSPTGQILGNFNSVGEFAHPIDCAVGGDTATHNSPDPKNILEFKWTPPANYQGAVIFNSTIAQDYSTFWMGVQSLPVEISSRLVNDPEANVPTRRAFPSTTPYNPPNKARAEASADFDPFYTGCSESKLCFGTPNGCVKSKNCKAVVAVKVFGDKYDFEMKSTGNPVWVGAGLSDDKKMGDDSVIECVKSPNGRINAYLSWTSGAPNYAAERTKNQLGINIINGSSIDDTIYCKVRREVETDINGKRFDLARTKYHLLIASGSSLKDSGVGFHDISFLASEDQRYLSDVSEVAGASRILIKLHGAFMIAAWIGFVSIGTLMARYYRQTWVGSSMCGKDVWFGWHRLLMAMTWVLTIAAIVLIWVELKAWSAEKNPHAILGSVTALLCFLQPIGAFFRPHPGASNRAVFNWLHWLGGNLAHIIAIVAIFFAVKLTKAELPDFVDWILVAYVAFHVIVHLILSVLGCVSEKSADSRVSSFPMKDLGTGRNAAYMDRNVDAPFSGFRKLVLGLYIVVISVLSVLLILITVLAPIEESWKAFRSKS